MSPRHLRSFVLSVLALLLSVSACRRSAHAPVTAPSSAPEGSTLSVAAARGASDASDAADSGTTRSRPVGDDVFSLIVRGALDLDGKAPPFLTLCPLRGATFVCGLADLLRVEGDTIVHQPELERGLPRTADGKLDGFVPSMVGSWPDDAWMAFEVTAMPPAHYQIYRWTTDRWVQLADLRDVGGLPMTPYRGGLLALHRFWEGGGQVRTELLTLGAARGSALRLAAGRLCGLEGEGLVSIAAGGGALFLEASDCRILETAIERWAPGRRQGIVELLPGEPTLFGLYAESGADAVTWGLTTDGRFDRGFLARFDGKSWRSEELPPPIQAVADYVRSPDGREWLRARADVGQESLWSRTASRGWVLEHEIGVPGVAQFWVADGDLWLLQQYSERYGEPERASLFRSRPVREVYVEDAGQGPLESHLAK